MPRLLDTGHEFSDPRDTENGDFDWVPLGMGGAMNKKIVAGALIAIPGLIALYAGAWVVSCTGIFGEIPFGYYRDFYLVKHAIKAHPCVKSSSYSRHEDMVLEDFHFTVRTLSGRLVRLWF